MYKGTMYKVQLPISKSIANRILLLQAIHGDPLMRVSSDMPDDVIVLHDALTRLREHTQGEPLTLYLKNCGTALRFLQVHIAHCYPGEPVTLTGDPRLMERDGKPTTQTTSARILHGEPVPAQEAESPYITMSRKMARMYRPDMGESIEADWSAAVFWYEYVAIHGGEMTLEGLREDSMQGDKVVADIYARYFGVQTTFTSGGANIKAKGERLKAKVEIDFTNCPDLYPAVALTCEVLKIALQASGTERLRFKESDRIEAVRLHEIRNDHRIAMALIAAGVLSLPLSKEKEDELQRIIAKSYPRFVEIVTQITLYSMSTPRVTHITPQKGINDDNLGKKHALSKLIHAANTEYVWLHDDDVVWPEAAINEKIDKIQSTKADLIILPLRMESLNEEPSLLEKLQIAEYAAIQELTMAAVKRNKAIMCSGANLIVRREVWLACESEIHPEIPSGDDMFLLEAVKRHGYRVTGIDRHEFTAIVRPQTSWRAFFRQRMRWAGKAPHYTDPDIIRSGRWIVAMNLIQLLCPLFILIKFPSEWALIRRREMSYNQPSAGNKQSSETTILVALLLEIVYPFYLLICLLGGLFRKTW